MSVATIPHTKVNVGSQNLGVVRLRMMLQGTCTCYLLQSEKYGAAHLKKDITDEVES